MTTWESIRVEEDDDDDKEIQREWYGKDGIILLIDCTKSMFEQSTQDSPMCFEISLKCAYSVMTNKIISGNKDVVGIVFFGTEKTENVNNFNSIYVFQNLDQPDANRVLQIESLLDEELHSFSKNYGHNDDYSMSDALWVCSTMFSNCRHKLGHKRLLLFTCNDDPYQGKPMQMQLQNQARKRADDLFDVGIEIHLMHIQKHGDNFDISKFYKHIIHVSDDEAIVMPNASEKFDELMTRVRRKDNKKRPLANIPLSLCKDVECSVGVYNLVRTQTKPTPVRLAKSNNEMVKTMTKQFHPVTGDIPLPSDIRKCQKYGMKRIHFENDEIAEMKHFEEPGIKLLGFKPKKFLKDYYHIRSSNFIYPNESKINGSICVFSALLNRCVERDVVAICRFTHRFNVSPRLVALLPQEEVLDENRVQLEPPGFHVIYLPYADNIRILVFEDEDTSESRRPVANQEQIDKAKNVIKKLSFKFSSESFENPTLQTHWRNIEALALNKDSLEDIIDYTLPDHERMRKRAGNFIEEFKDLVFPEGYVPGAKFAKRKPAASTAAVMEVDIKTEAKAGRLGKLTVPILKSFASKVKLKCGTKKAELIEAIKQHFSII